MGNIALGRLRHPSERVRLQVGGLSAKWTPYQVFWQVVNTGRDARAEFNGLRGGFENKQTDVNNPLVRDESAKFRGRHWIECFIVQNGRCVARSGEFVINIV